jgi:hypothetical protein
MSTVKNITRPLVLALMLGAATIAAAGPHNPAYVQSTPQGDVYVTPGGNLYLVPYGAPAVPYGAPVVPYGGTWRVDTPQGTTSGAYRDERPGPYRNGYEGTSPRCQRFFC